MSRVLEEALGPYVRPREEVLNIRRILSAHLNSCLHQEGGHDLSPLALGVPASLEGLDTSASAAKGLQREYLLAVKANAQARAEYEAARKRPGSPTAPAGRTAQDDRELLQGQVIMAKLREKEAKLEVVGRYVDVLGEKAAASPDFMTAVSIFEGSPALPPIPKEVLQGVNPDDASSEKLGLRDLLSTLERSILNAKMLRKREEQLLAEARALSSAMDAKPSPQTRLHALDVVRNELIDWIEKKLSQTAGDESEDEVDQPEAQERQSTEQRLGKITESYEKYLAARKSLLQLVSQSPQPQLAPPAELKDSSSTLSLPTAPEALHLTPYIETLLSSARKQKAFISQKSYLNVALSKQLKEACLALDHLADESQLLPKYPGPGSSRRNLKTGSSVLGTVESLTCTGRVKPWVFAADSAKIATLEAVTEKIEEGQVALEQAMNTLGKVHRLLGLDAVESSDLDNEQQPGPDGLKKRPPKAADVWAPLRGDLGLLNASETGQ